MFRPFCAVRPTSKTVSEVIAPPYDVLDSDEAREKAVGKPYSFLHISKSEIDLDKEISVYDDKVYQTSAKNYNNMLEKGVLIKEDKPCFYVYRAQMGDHIQTGLAVSASVEAYNEGRIRRHELTRVEKEDDRVKQIEAVGCQTGPALLAYKENEVPLVEEVIKKVTSKECLYSAIGDNDVRHTIWRIDDDLDIKTIQDSFDKVKTVYIADGHHRSAAASRIQKKNKETNKNHTGNENYNYFLAVAFPINQMKILDYNRVVKDLNGNSVEEFLAKLSINFNLKEVEKLELTHNNTFGLYIDYKWYEMSLKKPLDTKDPVKLLDVSILSDLVLTPILGIGDPRKDKRIDFVGGMRGLSELKRRVDSKEMSVAFAMYPTQMLELTSVADENKIMPPKSTWFEPKLADGLLSNPI